MRDGEGEGTRGTGDKGAAEEEGRYREWPEIRTGGRRGAEVDSKGRGF